METNNKQFSRMKVMFILEMVTFIFLFVCIQLSYKQYIYLFLFLLLLLTIYTFFHQYITLKEIFTQIRQVIDYIDQNKEELIMEGDIGLLYDKILNLNKRIDAYSKLILEEKNRLKETIENICHQMKTPLSSISINNELLMQEVKNKRLEINQQQIEKIKYFLNSLLTLAKLENHAVEFDFQKLPLHYLMNLSLQNVHSFYRDCIINNYIQDIDFYYDENWLVEAIVNILKNALEQKDVHHLTITNEIIGQYLKLYIQDDGHGIDQKDIPHLFERFYKCQNQKKDSIGIGLALSQEIVKEHHGYIDVYNKDGACFELTFPLLPVSQKIKL